MSGMTGTALSLLRVGRIYRVEHVRKGVFEARITALHGNDVTVVITAGSAQYLANPDRGPGDEMAFDSRMASWFPIAQTPGKSR